MIIDFYNRNGGSPTPTPVDLSGVVASADLSGTTLNLDNPSGTTIDSVDFSGIIPDLTNYYTKTETDNAISASTSNYYTKAEIDNDSEVVSRALNDLDTRVSGNTSDIEALQAQITGSTDAYELSPSTAYTSNKVAFVGDNLGYKDTLGTTTTYFPASTTIKYVVSISQADYDLLTPSSDTLYLITS